MTPREKAERLLKLQEGRPSELGMPRWAVDHEIRELAPDIARALLEQCRAVEELNARIAKLEQRPELIARYCDNEAVKNEARIRDIPNGFGCIDHGEAQERKESVERTNAEEMGEQIAALTRERDGLAEERNGYIAEQDEARAEVARVNQFRENAAAKHQRVRDERDSLSAQLAEAQQLAKDLRADVTRMETELHGKIDELEASQARVRELEEKAARHEQERNERIESLDL